MAIGRKKLLELIENGESNSVEFKRKGTAPEKLSKEICAFANTKGGFLIIGVDDDRKLIGVKSEKTEIDLIETACQFYINPVPSYEIDVIQLLSVDVVIAHIPQSMKKPHKVKLFDAERKKTYWRAYIRYGENSVIASREMTNLMAFLVDDKPIKNISIGKTEKILFEHLEKNSRTNVKEFSKIANISRRRAERILIQMVRLGLLIIHNDTKQDYFTMN
ncbi:MAG: ATP-binding protein [Ignavibacteria bacterium]|jgi:predicted HTH transcriptional regulator|nr:ATP-binding protein [Ignavibacteria bacterium]